MFEGNIWLYTIMTSIFVRRNYIRHKSKNKWIRLLIKQEKGSNYWPYLFIKTRLFECNAAWKFQINRLRTLNVAGSSRSQCRKKAWWINSVRSWRRSMGRSQEIHYYLLLIFICHYLLLFVMQQQKTNIINKINLMTNLLNKKGENDIKGKNLCRSIKPLPLKSPYKWSKRAPFLARDDDASVLARLVNRHWP